MDESRIFNKTYNILSKSLDVSARRHNLITGNIANMDTVGYTPKDLDFNRTLNRVLKEKSDAVLDRTHDKHFDYVTDENGNPLNGTDSGEVDIYHLDSVNIDTEMMNLTTNNIKYRSTTEMLLRKMTILRYSIDEASR